MGCRRDGSWTVISSYQSSCWPDLSGQFRSVFTLCGLKGGVSYCSFQSEGSTEGFLLALFVFYSFVKGSLAIKRCDRCEFVLWSALSLVQFEVSAGVRVYEGDKG